jgi:MoaA/NifB/PqqE/SkfB family radical SAM enzyme
LSPSEIEGVLRDPLFKRLRCVVVSGGEPTVRKDLDEILSAVHRVVPRAHIVLSSSAMLPERLMQVVKAALSEGIKLEVGVSLDGIASRHDEARGLPGLFEKVDRTLRELAELKRQQPGSLGVKVGFVLSDATVDQMDAVRGYTTALGFDFNPQWYNQAPYYGNVGRDLLTDTVPLERAARTLPVTALNTIGKRALRGEPLGYRCSTLHTACLLKSNGDVAPCFKYWDETAGNVRQETPSSIWKSHRARKTRKLVRDCEGCLNACGVIWSSDANPVWRMGLAMRRAGARLKSLGGLGGRAAAHRP